MPGSGKSSTSEILIKNGFVCLRFGEQTDTGLKEMGLALTEKNEKMYREYIRKKLGMAAMAIKLKPRLDKLLKKENKIVLDGLYSWEEYTYLKKFYPNLILVAVYARPDVRYKRLAGRKIRPLSKKEARSRDIAEIEKLNKGGPIAIADYLIDNNFSKAKLKSKVQEILKLLVK